MSAAAVAARFLRRGSARAAMLYVGRRLCGKFSEGVWAGRHAWSMSAAAVAASFLRGCTVGEPPCSMSAAAVTVSI